MSSSSNGRIGVGTLIALLAIDVVLFLGAAILHAGIDVRLGSNDLMLGQILPATIVEGLIGLLAAATLYAIATRRLWTWGFALGAHLFGLAGVILGLSIVAHGSDPHQAINVETHIAMLVAMAIGLLLLVLPPVHGALAWGK